MMRGIGELVELIASCVTLRPGDVLATGTPAGVGSSFSPPRFLRDGDVVRVVIEGIGEIANPVRARTAAGKPARAASKL